MSRFVDYLHKTAARLPDKLAFSDGETSFTFWELRQAAGAIGEALHQAGAAGEAVALCMGRSPRFVAAFLGVLAAGSCAVPLDMQAPRDRLKAMGERVSPRFVLCEEGTQALTQSLFPSSCILSYQTAAAGAFFGPLGKRASGDGLAYIVFTSGSTGVPKAVAVRESSLMDYAAALPEAVGFCEGSVFGCQAPLYMDAWLKELIGAVVKGGSVYLLPPELFVQPLTLVQRLNAWGINTLCWVSSALSLVSRFRTFDTAVPEGLELVCFGGEPLSPRQLNRWMAACPKARFFQLYGPTECTGMSFYYAVPGPVPEGASIPLGRPFAGTTAYVLDEQGRPAREGEIYIGGPCVMAGYYGDEELTRRVLQVDPVDTASGRTFYATGDLARYDEEGNLLFLGRWDRQIKHLGHRVELDEIERAALQLKGVEACASTYDPNRGRLCLQYVGAASVQEVKLGLQQRLPGYMVPSRLVQVPTLPRLPNGKIDRNKLREE